MLPWELRKRQFLPVNQNLSSVHFSLAKFQLVSSNLALAMIWQMTHNHKLPKLCSATLRGCLHEKTRIGVTFIPGWLFDFVSLLHDDWVISSLYLKAHFMLIKYTCDSKSQTLRMRYPFQSTGRPISHRNAFRVYMIPLRDFVPEWNSRPGTTTGVNSRRGDSRRHDILWWYHVNKYRAMRGNQSELARAWKSLRRHVNTPLGLDLFLSSVATDGKDAHGLKLEKVGPDFSSFNAMPAKPTKNYYTPYSFINLFDIFFITLQGHVFCVWVKALRNLSPNIHIQILQTDLYIKP